MTIEITSKQTDIIIVEIMNTNPIEISVETPQVTIETNGLFSLAFGDYITGNQKGTPNGVATLDSQGLVPLYQIPDNPSVAKTTEVTQMINNLNAVTVGNIYW